MKKSLLLFALPLLFITTINNAYAGGIKYGPVAGLNLANISGSDADGNSMKIGAHVGVGFDFSINDNFSIAPSILYSMKGCELTVLSVKVKSNTNYIEIPILAKYQLDNGINFSAGPYVGILAAAHLSSDDETVDTKDSFNSTDIGMKFGVGYMMKSGFGIGVNYGLGLTTIDKAVNGTSADIKNNVIGISLCYMLGGK